MIYMITQTANKYLLTVLLKYGRVVCWLCSTRRRCTLYPFSFAEVRVTFKKLSRQVRQQCDGPLPRLRASNPELILNMNSVWYRIKLGDGSLESAIARNDLANQRNFAL